MEDKFPKFAFTILIIGIITALFVLINSILHTSIGSKISNPGLSPKDMLGPNSKY